MCQENGLIEFLDLSRLYNVEASAKIKKLEVAGRQLHSILRRMVQHNYLEQFTRDNRQNVEKPLGTNTVSQNGNTGKSGKGTTGFTKEQIQELGELFGIRNRDTDNDDHQGSEPPSPPAHRANSGNDDNDDDLELKMDPRDVSPQSSPARHDMENEGESVAGSSPFKLSLVQQLKVPGFAPAGSTSASEGLKKTAAAAGAVSLCRISLNSCYVAGSAIGDKVVTIWPTEKDSSPAPSTTIRLLSPLTTISWLAADPQQDQVRRLLLCLRVVHCYLLTEDCHFIAVTAAAPIRLG